MPPPAWRAESFALGQIRVGISGRTRGGAATSTRPSCPHTARLAYAAERMTSVEVNGSFYSLQRHVVCAVARGDARRLRVRREGQPVHHPHEAARRYRRGPGQLLGVRRPRARTEARPRPLAVAGWFRSTPPGWRTSSTDSPAPRPRRLVWRGRMTRRSRSPRPGRRRGRAAGPPRPGSRRQRYATLRRRRTCCGPTTSARYGPMRPVTSLSSTPTPAACGTCGCTGIPSCTPVGTGTARTSGRNGAAVGGGRAGRVRLLRQRRPRTRAWDAVGLLERLGR